MKRSILVILPLVLFGILTACGTDDKIPPKSVNVDGMQIKIAVGDTVLTAIPETNSSAEAFLALLEEQPVTLEMHDYAGMEKVGELGTDLPRNDSQISVDAGDIILYQGNQIAVYYGTNSWNFTRLAVIENATRESLLDVLGSGDVRVTFSLLK